MPNQKADIRCYVAPEVQAAWRAQSAGRGFSINQYTKEIVLERLGLLHPHYFEWPMSERRAYLRGK